MFLSFSRERGAFHCEAEPPFLKHRLTRSHQLALIIMRCFVANF